MKPKVIHVTPEIATEWLGHNYEKNRHIRVSYVNQLTEVMRSGRFVADNGQTIVFGENGTLYDGQHRLSAIIESGCAQDLLVVWVKDGEKAYLTIDNGTKRQAGDFLRELKDQNACAAYGKVMACVEWSGSPLLSCLQGKWATSVMVDRGMIISYCNSHAEEVQETVRIARGMRDEVGCGAQSAYSAFIGIVRYCGKDDMLPEFIDDFHSLAPDSKTIQAVKQMIMKASIRSGGVDAKWLIGTLLDAYMHYREMDGSTMLNKQTLRIKQYSGYVANERERRQHGVELQACQDGMGKE